MLTASGLSRSFGSRTLFTAVSLQLGSGRRVALVGSNGPGKPTLIETIVGLQEPDAGEVHRPRNLRIGYLPQELPDEVGRSVFEQAMLGAGPITELARRIEALGTRIGETAGDEQNRLLVEFGEAQSRFEQLGGYAVEAEATGSCPAWALIRPTTTGPWTRCRAGGACGSPWPGCCCRPPTC